MDVLVKLYDVLGKIFSLKMNIYGYNVSFMNILAFGFITGVCAIFIKRLLS